jgi:hypothetical protein
MNNISLDLGNKKPQEPSKEKHTRYAVLAIDSMDRVTIVSALFTRKARMSQDYHKRKRAGESHLLKARVGVVIEEVF